MLTNIKQHANHAEGVQYATKSNAFVERYHRSSQEECLSYERPTTLEHARQATFDFRQHYNFQRPNQARSCGNQPPRTAFPTLPSLPPLPQIVDPDGWLDDLHGLHLERKVDRHGMVSVDLKRYYVSAKLAGHRVSEAPGRQDPQRARLSRAAPPEVLAYQRFGRSSAHL